MDPLSPAPRSTAPEPGPPVSGSPWAPVGTVRWHPGSNESVGAFARRPATYLVEWDLQLSSGLSLLSVRHPQVALGARPLGFRWAVRCDGSQEGLENPRKSEPWDPRSVTSGGSAHAHFVFAYSPKPAEVALLRHIETAGGCVLPPLRLAAGTLRVRFLTANGDRSALPKRLGARACLVSHRPLTSTRLRDEWDRQLPGIPSLTHRQSEVLLEAVRAGYCGVSRRSDVREAARRLSLGRRTTEEHLRAAESTVVRSAVPLIELGHRGGEMIRAEAPVNHFGESSSEFVLSVNLALRAGHVACVRLLRSPLRRAIRRSNPYIERILEDLRTGKENPGDILVDLQVGPFERKVLEELGPIPRSESRTYAEIARRRGHPGAARAVGNAGAHHPVPHVTPCHRVVPAPGGIGNYSATGGPETKRKLLVREEAFFPDRAEPVLLGDGDGQGAVRPRAPDRIGPPKMRSKETDRGDP